MRAKILRELIINLSEQEVEALVEEFRLMRLNSDYYRDRHADKNTALGILEQTIVKNELR